MHQVDDSLRFGTKAFLARKEEKIRTFKMKNRKMMTPISMEFNGTSFCRNPLCTNMMRNRAKIDRLDKAIGNEGFESMRALA